MHNVEIVLDILGISQSSVGNSEGSLYPKWISEQGLQCMDRSKSPVGVCILQQGYTPVCAYLHMHTALSPTHLYNIHM